MGSLLDCCHSSAERSTPLYLARNLERDIRNRAADSIAGCCCGSAALDSDERSYVTTGIGYLTLVVGLCAFLELSLGVVRLLIKILIFAGVAVALAGMGWFVFGGSGDKFIPYNTLIAVCGLLILVTVVAVKKLSDRFMLLLNRRVLAIGTLVFAVEALWGNLSRNLHYQTPRVLGHLAFAVFLLSFALVAFQMISANERRLMSIENELAVARRLQFSILPTSIPEVRNILIAVAYQPTDCRRWRFL